MTDCDGARAGSTRTGDNDAKPQPEIRLRRAWQIEQRALSERRERQLHHAVAAFFADIEIALGIERDPDRPFERRAIRKGRDFADERARGVEDLNGARVVVHNEEIVIGIQRHREHRREVAGGGRNAADVLAKGIEDLHRAILFLADIDVPLAIGHHIQRFEQLGRSNSGAAKPVQEIPFRIEDLHAVVQVSHVDRAGFRIDPAGRLLDFPVSAPRLSECEEEGAIRRELLYAAVEGVEDVDIAVVIDIDIPERPLSLMEQELPS